MSTHNVIYQVKRVAVNGVDCSIVLHEEVDDSKVNCALIALINVLLLSPGLSTMCVTLHQLINKCLQQDNEVSKDQLVKVLSNIGVQQNSTIDINQLVAILPNLCRHHENGANGLTEELKVDPSFNGSFQDGLEMSIFRLFNVGLVHGWIINPENDPLAYERVSRYSYEQSQKLLIESYELQSNNNGGMINTTQESILQDANYIKSFLAHSVTQLTEYGLQHLKEIMVEKSFAVLYRDSSFFTLHKNNGSLYVLSVNDNYQDNNDIVWRCLKSVNGLNDTFYTGSFIPVTMDRSLTNATQNFSTVDRVTSNPFTDSHANEKPNERTTIDNTLVNTRVNHQVEDDEELARRLQEQEDQQYAEQLNNASNNRNAARGRNSAGRMANNTTKDTTNKQESQKKRHKLKNKFLQRNKNKKSCVLM